MDDSHQRGIFQRFAEPCYWAPIGWIAYLAALYLVFVLLVGLALGVVHLLLPSTQHVTVISGR
jgi:hypothetical protein